MNETLDTYKQDIASFLRLWCEPDEKIANEYQGHLPDMHRRDFRWFFVRSRGIGPYNDTGEFFGSI
jgi:hypothetical protein